MLCGVWIVGEEKNRGVGWETERRRDVNWASTRSLSLPFLLNLFSSSPLKWCFTQQYPCFPTAGRSTSENSGLTHYSIRNKTIISWPERIKTGSINQSSAPCSPASQATWCCLYSFVFTNNQIDFFFPFLERWRSDFWNILLITF